MELRQRRILAQKHGLPEAVARAVQRVDAAQLSRLLSEKDESSAQSATATAPEARVSSDTASPSLIKEVAPTTEALLQQLEARVEKAVRYGLAKADFGLARHAFTTALSLLFTLSGYLPYVWDSAQSLVARYLGAEWASSQVVVSMAFVALYGLCSTLTDLPFAVWRAFVLEARYGFNKQTPALFVKDTALQLAVSGAIGLPVVGCVVWIILSTGPHFYAWASAALVAIQLLMLVVYPNFIAPLFNTFTRLEPSDPLGARIFALADRQGFPLTNLFVVDGSRRSAHSNAYMYGFGRAKRIVLYDTLLAHASHEEVREWAGCCGARLLRRGLHRVSRSLCAVGWAGRTASACLCASGACPWYSLCISRISLPLLSPVTSCCPCRSWLFSRTR
jgi:Zn-dependent protease with chaperone function